MVIIHRIINWLITTDQNRKDRRNPQNQIFKDALVIQQEEQTIAEPQE